MDEMFVRRPAFTGANLRRNQRRLAVFMEQWETIRSRRGARYKLRLTIPLQGCAHKKVSVVCVKQVKKNVYMLEAAPLGPNFQTYHYIRLVQNEHGVWTFDRVIAASDPANRTPYGRGEIMRSCFV